MKKKYHIVKMFFNRVNEEEKTYASISGSLSEYNGRRRVAVTFGKV